MPRKTKLLSLVISLLVIAATSAGLLVDQSGTAEPTKFLQHANPGLYQVVSAADGDTITVQSGSSTEKVRFIGVDTPEKNDVRKPIQCFAKAASAFTAQRVEGQRVRLETDPQGDSRDRYGRLLRYVYLADGTLLNKAIITEGYGFAMTGFPFSKMEEFRVAERQAREKNRGLWKECTVDAARGYPQTNAVP